uniref:DNA2/NAM7 helicase-like C-terminal domain-containing protein n=1 Tax=Palpitomonas bilix TaxID=652834 RepID=A0A7S3GC23_9EUKA|mmetsp:Transcript_42558/g.109429  ORF Transcript_42558/g.109429 Transcript_42558/m.109429 type:complete len:792 (+) Transcript_42558:704-3079(+)
MIYWDMNVVSALANSVDGAMYGKACEDVDQMMKQSSLCTDSFFRPGTALFRNRRLAELFENLSLSMQPVSDPADGSLVNHPNIPFLGLFREMTEEERQSFGEVGERLVRCLRHQRAFDSMLQQFSALQADLLRFVTRMDHAPVGAWMDSQRRAQSGKMLPAGSGDRSMLSHFEQQRFLLQSVRDTLSKVQSFGQATRHPRYTQSIRGGRNESHPTHQTKALLPLERQCFQILTGFFWGEPMDLVFPDTAPLLNACEILGRFEYGTVGGALQMKGKELEERALALQRLVEHVNKITHTDVNNLRASLSQNEKVRLFYEGIRQCASEREQQLGDGTDRRGRLSSSPAFRPLQEAGRFFRNAERADHSYRPCWDETQKDCLGRLMHQVLLFERREEKCRRLQRASVFSHKAIHAGTSSGMFIRMRELKELRVGIYIIDEAGLTPTYEFLQFMLLPTLRQIVMIGDHMQLSPASKNFFLSCEREKTRGSTEYQDLPYSYNTSWFEQLVRGYTRSSSRLEPSDPPEESKEERRHSVCGRIPHYNLTVQYRMHRDIASLCTIYQELRCGVKENSRPLTPLLGDKRVVFCHHGHDMDAAGTTCANRNEAKAVMDLVRKYAESGVSLSDIAVITPYKGQFHILLELCRKQGYRVDLSTADLTAPRLAEQDVELAKHGRQTDPRKEENKKQKEDRLKVSTVDSFQGLESEIVIVSLAKSQKRRGDQTTDARGEIGFVKFLKRANVLLTRAKSQMVLFGDWDLLTTEKGKATYIGSRCLLLANGEAQGLPYSVQKGRLHTH